MLNKEGAQGIPHALSIPVRNTSGVVTSGEPVGCHAVGFVRHGDTYLVLEPNGGLYKFESEDVFKTEVASYLVDTIAWDSAWNLAAIRATGTEPVSSAPMNMEYLEESDTKD